MHTQFMESLASVFMFIRHTASSPFYQYPFYPSGDQPGQHSDYQIPTSSNPPYSVQYPNYVPSYPYTPLPVAARTYGPTTQAAHTPSLTDIPSAANQEIHPPESMTDTSTPSGSGQRRVLRGTTTEMQPIRTRFIHEVPGMERPRSTPNVSNRASQYREHNEKLYLNKIKTPTVDSQLMTPNSPPISLTSPSTPDSHPSIVVSFSQDQLPSLSHTMMEDKSLSQEELQRIFPPSARINVPSLSGSIQNSKWVCQWEDCNERVRSQDRTAHALEHYGKKRYTCSWLVTITKWQLYHRHIHPLINICSGHTFARSQDKKRHLREQALCEVWYVDQLSF